MSKDLIDILFEQDREFPLYHFLNEKGLLIEVLTVGELTDRLTDLAKKLDSFEPGSRALLVFPTCKEFLVAFFGCIYAGIIPVPVSLPSRRNGMRHIEAIANDSKVSIAIFESDSYTQLKPGIKSLISDQSAVFVLGDEAIHDQGDYPKRRYPNSNIAFLQYTSGSTSSPKGVIVTHENIIENQEMLHERFETNKDSIFLGWTPLHHDMGLVGNVMHPLYMGCKCYLISPVVLLMRPKVLLQALSRYNISVTGGPNFSYKNILKRVTKEKLRDLDLNLEGLKVLYNGAEPIEVDVMDDFIELFANYGLAANVFLPCYGMAEATLMATGIYAHDEYRYKKVSSKLLQKGISAEASDDDDSQLLASCGTAANGVQIRIRCSNTGDILGLNRIGIIELKGRSITPGYWDHVGDKINLKNSNKWLDTGDLGFLDEENELYICGRDKDLIILDGRNIYPQDLEKAVEETDVELGTLESAAFSHGSNVYLIVEISRKSLRKLSIHMITSLKARIVKNIYQEFGVSIANVSIVRPHTIPKTTSHKIQRQKLKKQYFENEIEEITVHD